MSSGSVARGLGLSMCCLVLLGTMPVVSNLRPQSFDALSFALALSVWQVFFALPGFAFELRGGKGVFGVWMRPGVRARMIAVALLTGTIFGLSTWLYVLGVGKAGATNAAVAIQAYPLFAILWESLFLKRRKTAAELGLTLCLLAALYFLGTGGTWRLSGLSPWFLAALSVPFLWSIAHVVIKEELGRTPITPAQVTFFRVAVSTVFLAIVLWASGSSAGPGMAEVLAAPVSVLMGLIYFLELILWFHAVRHIDVSLASSITTPWPALTMVLAFFLLGDAIEPHQVGALAVVVACIYGLMLASLGKAKRVGTTKTG